MSRLALLADVHGNRPALDAVVAALREREPDGWVCAGDLVGYGAAPDECVENVLALSPLTVVAGNHDLLALGRLDPPRDAPAVLESTRWTARRIGRDTRAALEALPLRARTADGVAVAHGSLTDPECYVRTAEAAGRELAALAAEDPEATALVLGHTHLPLRAEREGRVAVNPGGVGQSRERRLHARAALLDTRTGAVEHLVVGYNLEAALAAQRAARLPEEFLHLRPRRLARLRRAARRLRG